LAFMNVSSCRAFILARTRASYRTKSQIIELSALFVDHINHTDTMATRLRTPLRAGLRQLSTAARSTRTPRSTTFAYTAGTILVGTTLAIGLDFPRIQNSFLAHAEVSESPDKPARNERDGSRRKSLILTTVWTELMV
jgi:hypothetical protein